MIANRHLLLVIIVCVTAASAAAQENDRQRGIVQRIREWLSQQDKNNDGKITEDEAAGLVKSNFAKIDADGNGEITRSELLARAQNLQRNPGDNQQRRQQTLSTRRMLAEVPEDVVIEPDLAYREGDSEAWRLDLVRPKAEPDGLRPGIVFIHGGGWRNGDKRAGTFLNGAIEYAQRGYVCITVNYRMLDEAPITACVEDVKNAVRWFRAHADTYHLDPNRIGGYGNSAGAHLVCMLGLAGPEAGLEGDGPYQDQSSALQAVCASATPTDFSLFPAQSGERRTNRGGILTGSLEERQALAKRVSPVTYVADDAPPLLLIQGTADALVDVKHSDQMVAALRGAGVEDVTYMRVDGAGHGVFNEHAGETKPAMREFFARTIGGGTKPTE